MNWFKSREREREREILRTAIRWCRASVLKVIRLQRGCRDSCRTAVDLGGRIKRIPEGKKSEHAGKTRGKGNRDGKESGG